VDKPVLDSLESVCAFILNRISWGKVVPFLGAGVNLYGRPPKTRFRHSASDFLPSGRELAGHLAHSFQFPYRGKIKELDRISQFVHAQVGVTGLYDELHSVFDRNYPVTRLHEILALVPVLLEKKGYPARYRLIVTTNYDDLMERTLQAAGIPFDLVCYLADGEYRGKFWHRPPGGSPCVILKPNEYCGLQPDKRVVVLKIHGAVARINTEREFEGFVITEDHYIDYLTNTDLSSLFPQPLPNDLRNSHLLFLGYGLRDWNLRVILRRIANEQKLKVPSWAVQSHPDPLDKMIWEKRDLHILEMQLEDLMDKLLLMAQGFPRAPRPTALKKEAHA
jgi:hypothetical protein